MWSPSSTEDWLACPRLWWLKRQGVQGRAQDESARDMGSTFHAHMAAYWLARGDLRLYTMAAPWPRILHTVIEQEGQMLAEQGVVDVEVNLGGNEGGTEGGAEGDADEEAARHGRYPGTCDLITENGAGLTVTDYKTKVKMEAWYADRELRETQRSWQLKQYAWFAQVKYGRPVTHVRKLLVTLGPVLKVWLVSYPVTQQKLSDWYTQAQIIWRQMDDQVDHMRDTWQNGDSCERYGWQWRCAYYGKCWEGE